MSRAATITHARVGANKLWAGTVVVQPAASTRAHHHGELETVIYIVRGRARFRWGDRLENVVEADPGDFVYVPPFVPHQEMNALPDEAVEAVVVRSGQDPIVVNLDIPSPEPGAPVTSSDPFHSNAQRGERARLPSCHRMRDPHCSRSPALGSGSRHLPRKTQLMKPCSVEGSYR